MESVSIPTTKLPLNALTPHPENYNSHSGDQIKELAESLTTFGQFKNIVVWTCSENITLENGLQLHEGLTYILAGHGLWQAAMEAGLDELEVKDYSGLSYEMALTLLMTDNAAPLGSEPIPEKLASLMSKTRQLVADRPGLQAMMNRLKERAGLNGAGTGSDGKESPEPQIDKAKELAELWGTKTGQIWSLGDHRLAVGDCTDKATVEALMRGERAEMMFTDPPYDYESLGKGGAFAKQNDKVKSDIEHISKFDPAPLFELFPLYLEVVNCYIFCNRGLLPRYFSLIKKDYSFDLLTWHKEVFIPNAGQHHYPDTEYIFFIRRGGVFNSGLSSEHYYKYYISRKDDISGHPTVKPLSLVERKVRVSSRERGIVVDPFLGSGTTLIACQNLSRKCLAAEIDPGYAAVSLQRFFEATGIEPNLINSV